MLEERTASSIYLEFPVPFHLWALYSSQVKLQVEPSDHWVCRSAYMEQLLQAGWPRFENIEERRRCDPIP